MNPVAKNAYKFNKCIAFKDKSKYNRKDNRDWLEDDEPPVSILTRVLTGGNQNESTLTTVANYSNNRSKS